MMSTHLTIMLFFLIKGIDAAYMSKKFHMITCIAVVGKGSSKQYWLDGSLCACLTRVRVAYHSSLTHYARVSRIATKSHSHTPVLQNLTHKNQ